MTPLLAETVITFDAAPSHLPAVDGRRPASKTVREWARVGGSAPGGGRVVLESARVGGRRVTSVEALARFVAAASATRPPSRRDPRPPAGRRARPHSPTRSS